MSATVRMCERTRAAKMPCEALVDEVVEAHGGLDIFFANAGISGGFATIAEQTEADWAEILRVNLIGPFLAIKYAGPAIAARGGGSIICTASVAGLRSGAGRRSLFGVKGRRNQPRSECGTAAVGLGRAGERHLPRPDRDRHDPAALRAGPRATGREERLGELNPLQRGGEPQEIAQAALYLASNEASYVNGTAWWSTAGCRAVTRPPTGSTSGCFRPSASPAAAPRHERSRP